MTQPSADVHLSNSRREARKVGIASFVGTAIEWYDFFIYGILAVLVLGPQFFPTGNETVSQLGALATFAVGYVARPVGGVLAGHFGDRIGRKRMLVLSLIVMGGSTFAVGLLPGYAEVGIVAPVILVILRLLQGLAVGAEWGGAALMAVEHAPPKRRALYGTAPQLGVPAGAAMAYGMVLVLSAITGSAFTQWGWRIAFLASFVLVIVGLVARRTLTESPMFEKAIKHGPTRVPVVKVLRRYPVGVLVAVFATAPSTAIGALVLAFCLSYGTSEIGYSRNTLLVVLIVTSVIQAGAILLLAQTADRWGRRKTMLIGSAAQLGAVLLFFPLFDTGVVIVAAVAISIVLAAGAAQYALLPTLLSDLFPTDVRYTGTSLGYQLGSVVGGSPATIIATVILASTGSSMLIGAYLAGMTVLSIIAILFAHTPTLTNPAVEEDEQLVQEPSRLA